MSDALPLTPPVRGELEAYGVSSAVPIAARGNSVVVAAPPSPAYAGPVLAAVVGRSDDTGTLPVLLLVPDAALEAWAQTAALAAAAVGKTAAAGPFASRAAHHLTSGRVDLLVTTLPTAAELLRRSALAPERLSALVVAWPEAELSEESFVPVFADLPKDTQRVVFTADPERAATFVERYAWRAPLVGPLATPPDAPVAARCRVASVGWDGRLAALGAAADLLEADHLTVWTADESSHAEITRRLAAHGVAATLAAGTIPTDGAMAFYDAPPPELLAQAVPARTVVLATPGTESYLARVAGRLEPLTLPGVLDEADRAIQADRNAIRARIAGGIDRAAYATIAPLLDRFTPGEVAVALQSLWAGSRTRPAPAAAPAPRSPAAAPRPRVWLSLGRKDGATIGEVLAFVNLDCGVARDGLGRVDLKETFTLIEFASDDQAHRALDKLQGATFKGRRLSARIDRGPRRAT
ncbi:MAG: DbpA RNA binding domain-containing protein [Gemmatimonadales bacterium]